MESRRLLRRLAAGIRGTDYYADPRRYWERRHGAHAGLRGVGRLDLPESANADDYAVKSRHVEELLRSIHGGGSPRLLDAGCGVGVFTQVAHDLGYRVTGLDFSSSALSVARERLPASVVLHEGDLMSACAFGTFDVVMAIDVLIHVVDEATWRNSVRTLASAVEPGGHLVIQEYLRPQGARSLPPAEHVAARTLSQYVSELPSWRVVVHDHYALAHEKAEKDLLAFARSS